MSRVLTVFFNDFHRQDPVNLIVIAQWLARCRQTLITRPEVRFNLTWVSK